MKPGCTPGLPAGCIFPRLADKLPVVMVDAVRDVKVPIGAEKDPAVTEVVVSVTIFSRFADKLVVMCGQ